LGHFERVDLRAARWRQPDELYTYFVGCSWYSSTLRVELIRLPFLPSYFQGKSTAEVMQLRAYYPPGWRWEFLGENVTRMMNGYPPGFAAEHTPYATGGVTGDRWVLAVRPWWPTLLAAILPAIWLYRFRGADGRSRLQVSLRELLIAFTLLAAMLGAILWLKN
jgi:hypothetical protein